jgi:serine/threonine protein kinase
MLHQDLRPDNIMIDTTGTVKIIDFGSTRVTGVYEAGPRTEAEEILGTVQYTAPEYFLGDPGTTQSDIFSLGVICYQILTGRLPYGAGIARARSQSQMNRLTYMPACEFNSDVPAWMDAAIRQAAHLDSSKRTEALSEFVHDLWQPNPRYAGTRSVPLIERNPLLFWKGLSVLLLILNVVLLYRLSR